MKQSEILLAWVPLLWTCSLSNLPAEMRFHLSILRASAAVDVADTMLLEVQQAMDVERSRRHVAITKFVGAGYAREVPHHWRPAAGSGNATSSGVTVKHLLLFIGWAVWVGCAVAVAVGDSPRCDCGCIGTRIPQRSIVSS